MKEEFKEIKFAKTSMQMISLCNSIIEKYLKGGFRLTLRQLYYQLVTQNAITNEERSYKKLGQLLSHGRLAGLIDWDAIEDRGRLPRIPNQFADLAELAEAAIQSYRLPRWEGQDYYVELWVEKEALSGVLAPMAAEYHVTLSVNKGYSSQSAMYRAATERMIDQDNPVVVLYLGDHDPSGEDMVRDIEERLTMFGVSDLEVRKIALTWAQIQQRSPPPNPAKLTDSRARKYIAQYGNECWEVDALPPDVLQRIIRNNIEGLLDADKMSAIKEKEESDKESLLIAVKDIMKQG